MSETTYAPKVGDRVKFLGLDSEWRRENGYESADGGGAWELIKAGYHGTVDDLVEDYEGDPRLFVIFDEVEMPMAAIARLMGMSTGWPLLASEVTPL